MLVRLCVSKSLLSPCHRFGKSLTIRKFNFGQDQWDETTLLQIEKDWRHKIGQEVNDVNLMNAKNGRKPFYVLSMFPYPSGQLHMGHVRVYAISDAIAHFRRMNGEHVIHPMGWDAFGLPAENAAIERALNPKEWTEQNVSAMKKQLSKLGCLFDWDRELSTSDPKYYKWTQFIFLKLFEHKLAFQQEAVVNWDPVDKTVLADEQVDADGRSWRSGAKVEKRPLKQWFLKTTNFSKDLHDSLEDPSLVDWRDIVKLQKHWIGECNGTRLAFKIDDLKSDITVWTGRPELIFGVEFIGISREHILNKREDLVDKEYDSKIGKIKLLSVKALNPFNGESLPIVVLENCEHFPENCDSVLGISSLNEKDMIVSKVLNLNLKKNVISSSQQGQEEVEKMINSEKYSNLKLDEAREEIMKHARLNHIGGYWTSSKLKDWLISRQRYWGTPIPIIHCPDCGPVPVPERDLPVELPDIHKLGCSKNNDSVSSPLADISEWVNVPCPNCNKMSQRETDTMDTFVDSSWYFLRFLDPKNELECVSEEKSKSMPVDIYIGGKEHATLHMFFARFITHFLHKIGISPIKEPFQRLLVQGMVKGQSYRVKGSGKYLKVEEVDTENKTEKSSGKPVVIDWEKMSKSKYNGVDPNLILDKYGCDTTRMMMLCDVGPASDRKWNEDSHNRVRNMQVRFLKLVSLAKVLQQETLPPLTEKQISTETEKLWDARNYYLKGINFAYFGRHGFNVVISRVQSFLNELWNSPGQMKRDCPDFQRGLATAIVVLAPIAPHFCAELWRGMQEIETKFCTEEFNFSKSVFHQTWPVLDHNYNLKLVIRDSGEDLTTINIALWKFQSLTQEEAFDLACHEPEVQQKVLPLDFSIHSFEKLDNFEAVLNFQVKRSIEEGRKLKKAKKEKKMLKKIEKENNATKA